MEFNELLNNYLSKLNVSQKDLAIYSGLSEASITRYLQGIRKPKANSKHLNNIINGLINISKDKNINVDSYEMLLEEFNKTLSDGLEVEYNVFISNLNSLLKEFNIKNSELARGIYNDSSHISKILSGTRKPGNLKQFISEVANYISNRIISNSELDKISNFLNINKQDIDNLSKLNKEIIIWLGSNNILNDDNSFSNFLFKLDDFNLNDYIKAIHFDELSIPPSVPHLPTRKEYYGIKRMMDSEIDFMKTTILSKSQEDCILYSDMPLEEMANDNEFPKKYMLGMAMMLKKGLHIHMIHDINRPFNEMMIGLESWIPLYMTGQISPYYLPSSQNNVFLHFLKVSGVAALEGNAITGNQKDGKYTLYRSKEDVKHYRLRAKELLDKASPLMNIYLENDKDKYYASFKNNWFLNNQRIVCSSLPIYFMNKRMLEEIVNNIANKDLIINYYNEISSIFYSTINKHKIHLTIPYINKEDYLNNPLNLSLSDIFMEEVIKIDYDTYLKYLDRLKDLEKEYPNFTLELSNNPIFHNLNYSIIENKLVVVSKENSPTIHFVIHHNKMVKAFSNFIPPIVEK